MHFVISGTWGPTDPTRAMLPFIFAASAIQDNDTVTLMLFHDAVLMAVAGGGAHAGPGGPPEPIRGSRLPSKREPVGLPALPGRSRHCFLIAGSARQAWRDERLSRGIKAARLEANSRLTRLIQGFG